MGRIELNRLLLIKHSLPDVVEALPPRDWHLSEEGRRRCDGLARALAPYDPDVIVCSHEAKARETGALIAGRLKLPLFAADGLHEHDRSHEPYLKKNDFEAAMARFFQRPADRVFGRESAEQAGARFDRAVSACLDAHPGGTPAIVAHGTVISLYVARQCGLEPFSLWKQLGLPSFVVLSLPGPRLERIVSEPAEDYERPQ